MSKTEGSRQFFGKTRLEAFSDGVFAIAITLLVLEVVVHPPGTLLEQVLAAWPTYVAYIISFLTIGAAWISHMALTERLTRVDTIFLRLNLLALMVVAFLPFPTHLVAENLKVVSDERVAVTIYGFTVLAIRILGFLLVKYAERERLIDAKREGSELNSEKRKLVPVLGGNVAAILLGLAFPRIAVVIYFGIAVYAVVPFREAARLLSNRP